MACTAILSRAAARPIDMGIAPDDCQPGPSRSGGRERFSRRLHPTPIEANPGADMTKHAAASIPDEADLVARACRGDASAVRLIIRQHNQRLYRIARSIVRDDGEAEDVLQEAYARAFIHLA